KSKIVAKINEPFYKYFERQDSITKTHTQKGYDMFLAVKNVKIAFEASPYSHFQEDFNRFFIFQGYYSYLAYVAFVQDKKLRGEMLEELKRQMKHYKLSKSQIFQYRRFARNYLFSLPLKKQIFYMLS